MISRRNIRVKVMQTLYSLEVYDIPCSKDGIIATNDEQNKEKTVILAKKSLSEHLAQADQLLIYLLYFLGEVMRYADKDARQRAAKYLPSKEDLHVNTKIINNLFLLQLMKDQDFISRVSAAHLAELSDPQFIRKKYNQLISSPEYQHYISNDGEEQGKDKKIIHYLFNDMLMKDEAFDQHLEDLFIHWPDDKEMARILVNNYINRPWSFNFRQLIGPEKKAYAMELIETVLEKKAYCLELIRPRLQNWDPERIAAIDMLVLYMGVCEFLYFPTIPPKVTINEYIDMAKTYSTPQSGQFINGILDNVLKDLKNNQQIIKTDRDKR